MATTKRVKGNLTPKSARSLVPSMQGETAKGKGRRFFLAIMVFVLVAFGAVPAFAYLGQSVADTNPSLVLSGQSNTVYVYTDNGSGIAYAQSNGTLTYDMPVNQTISYIESNLTAAMMTNYNVENITMVLSFSGNISLTAGFGTSVSSFVPFYSTNTTNKSTFAIPVAPQDITGNQSYHFMVELKSKATSYSVTFHSYGNSGLSTVFGVYTGEEIGYVLGGTVILVLAGLAGLFYDIDFRRS